MLIVISEKQFSKEIQERKFEIPTILELNEERHSVAKATKIANRSRKVSTCCTYLDILLIEIHSRKSFLRITFSDSWEFFSLCREMGYATSIIGCFEEILNGTSGVSSALNRGKYTTITWQQRRRIYRRRVTSLERRVPLLFLEFTRTLITVRLEGRRNNEHWVQLNSGSQREPVSNSKWNNVSDNDHYIPLIFLEHEVYDTTTSEVSLILRSIFTLSHKLPCDFIVEKNCDICIKLYRSPKLSITNILAVKYDDHEVKKSCQQPDNQRGRFIGRFTENAASEARDGIAGKPVSLPGFRSSPRDSAYVSRPDCQINNSTLSTYQFRNGLTVPMKYFLEIRCGKIVRWYVALTFPEFTQFDSVLESQPKKYVDSDLFAPKFRGNVTGRLLSSAKRGGSGRATTSSCIQSHFTVIPLILRLLSPV
ncbi:hypothetical protein E2986_11438 [Frieseomelitta varia]|uniref:Uncharacterized protein n=1 Tax=Frieseomelitta varia TaxID=561572 RepID=A0A833RVF2_9HYME|nr:hypothetical protein E2986_11438 [Frieseomelitta varia]